MPSESTSRSSSSCSARLQRARCVPSFISGSIRSPALNNAVMGERNSAHVLGMAVHFYAPRSGTVFQNTEAAVASDAADDQIIHGYGR